MDRVLWLALAAIVIGGLTAATLPGFRPDDPIDWRQPDEVEGVLVRSLVYGEPIPARPSGPWPVAHAKAAGALTGLGVFVVGLLVLIAANTARYVPDHAAPLLPDGSEPLPWR